MIVVILSPLLVFHWQLLVLTAPQHYLRTTHRQLLQEVTESSSLKLKNSPSVKSPNGVQIERILNSGMVCNVVCCAAKCPHVCSVYIIDCLMIT